MWKTENCFDVETKEKRTGTSAGMTTPVKRRDMNLDRHLALRGAADYLLLKYTEFIAHLPGKNRENLSIRESSRQFFEESPS